MKSAVRFLPSVGKRTHSLVLQLLEIGRGRGAREIFSYICFAQRQITSDTTGLHDLSIWMNCFTRAHLSIRTVQYNHVFLPSRAVGNLYML